MRFVIVGAGGVGGVTGACLRRAGEDVLLVVRREQAEAISRNGLEIVEKDGEPWTVHPRIATSIEACALTPDDVVFITAKSYDTQGIVDSIYAALPQGPAAVVCVQNGISNEVVSARRFPRTYGGMAYFQGRILGPGRIGAGLRKIVAGAYPRGTDELIEEICRRLTASGVESEVHDNIMSAKWTKLVTNCCNAVYAITSMTGAESALNRASVELLNAAWSEAEAALAAASIEHVPVKLLPVPEVTTMPLADAGNVAFYGSTWDDLAARKGKVEVDWFNGEIVRLGAKYGVATPVNRLLLDVCENLARDLEPPGKNTPEELLGMLG